MTVVQLADWMVKIAKDVAPRMNRQLELDRHMHDYRGPALDQSAINAVVVAYINQAMMTQCCDLALYASDIMPELDPDLMMNDPDDGSWKGR